MAKTDLGAKRQCPKCGTRFYDLGKDTPIVCISCSQKFEPEQTLKPRNRSAPQVVPKPTEQMSDDVVNENEIESLSGNNGEAGSNLGADLEIGNDDDDIAVEIKPGAAKDSST